MIKKITPKKVLIVVLGLAIIGFMIFAMYSQYKIIQKTHDEIATESTLIEKAESNLRVLQTLKEYEDVMLEQISTLEEAIPPTADEFGTILYLEEALEFSHSEINDIRFNNHVAQEDYNEMPIRVSYEGYYHGLVALIDNLQSGKRIVRIDGVRISRGSEGFPHIKADIDISLFYSK